LRTLREKRPKIPLGKILEATGPGFCVFFLLFSGVII
jgi:hypothetical protein